MNEKWEAELNLRAITNQLLSTPPKELGSWDPVNQLMVRHWCDVLGIEDLDYLNGSRVPVAMLHVWTMPGYRGEFPGGGSLDLLREASERLKLIGFTGIMAVEIRQDYLRPLQLGEVLRRRVRISAVSDLKQTAVGDGVFVTEEAEISSGSEHVGTTCLTLLCFRPSSIVSVETPIAAAKHGSQSQGSPLVSITSRFVCAAAIATRDFEDVHLDGDAARASGLKDIYLNIMTTMGLVQRCAEAELGVGQDISALNVKLLAPVFPGEHLRFGIASKTKSTLKVELMKASGLHASGTVTIRQNE